MIESFDGKLIDVLRANELFQFVDDRVLLDLEQNFQEVTVKRGGYCFCALHIGATK
jgi:hypothetical protein